MTKLDQGLCSTFGCHNKAGIEITILLPKRHKSHLFCHIHYPQYLSYIVASLSKNEEFKKELNEGLDLFFNHKD